MVEYVSGLMAYFEAAGEDERGEARKRQLSNASGALAAAFTEGGTGTYKFNYMGAARL